MKKNKVFGIIYSAKNKKTGEYYIGASKDNVDKRKEDHINKSKNESHLPFHEAIATYGVDAFDWHEEDTAQSANELASKEKEYIIEYNSQDNGYNSDSGGGFKKTVYQYSLEDGNLVATHISLEEAGRAVNTSKQQISRACLGVNLTCKNFYWSYNYTEPFIPKSDNRKKKVIYYNFANDIIEEFESVAEAAYAKGISKSGIAKYCRGERKPPNDVLWEYN